MPAERRAEWIAIDDYARARSLSRDAVWERIRLAQLAHREVNGAHYVQELDTYPRADAMVPSGYAEKAMASLLRLHDELMVEKEARFGLMQKLMEREQALAELKSYVRLLESRLGDGELKRSISPFESRTAPPVREAQPPPEAPAPAQPPAAEPPPAAQQATGAEASTFRPKAPAGIDGWRNW